MVDADESLQAEDVTPQGAPSLDDIEHDLNTVDTALDALDSGDLETAEALAAELDSPDARTPDATQGDDDGEAGSGPAS